MSTIEPPRTSPAGRGVGEPVLRDAVAGDCDAIARFVHELATEERFPGTVTSTAADVEGVLFGPDAFAEAVIAEVDGRAVGFALHYPTYSTVTGRRGVHLEDLFVVEAYRGQGVGERLVQHLAAKAGGGRGRLEWWVLHTNTAAHRFYRRLGAREVTELGVWRIDPPADGRRGATSADGPTSGHASS